MRFDAFISYSHENSLIAREIQKAIVNLGNSFEESKGIRIFRDETNFTVGKGLKKSIASALENSDYFIYLATPVAAKSEWIKIEMESYLSKNASNNLIIILLEGELKWDQQANIFKRSPNVAFPNLENVYFEDELLYIDFSNLQYKKDYSFSNDIFRDGIIDVLNALRGIPKDDLKSHFFKIEKSKLSKEYINSIFRALLGFGIIPLALFYFDLYSFPLLFMPLLSIIGAVITQLSVRLTIGLVLSLMPILFLLSLPSFEPGEYVSSEKYWLPLLGLSGFIAGGWLFNLFNKMLLKWNITAIYFLVGIITVVFTVIRWDNKFFTPLIGSFQFERIKLYWKEVYEGLATSFGRDLGFNYPVLSFLVASFLIGLLISFENSRYKSGTLKNYKNYYILSFPTNPFNIKKYYGRVLSVFFLLLVAATFFLNRRDYSVGKIISKSFEQLKAENVYESDIRLLLKYRAYTRQNGFNYKLLTAKIDTLFYQLSHKCNGEYDDKPVYGGNTNQLVDKPLLSGFIDSFQNIITQEEKINMVNNYANSAVACGAIHPVIESSRCLRMIGENERADSILLSAQPLLNQSKNMAFGFLLAAELYKNNFQKQAAAILKREFARTGTYMGYEYNINNFGTSGADNLAIAKTIAESGFLSNIEKFDNNYAGLFPFILSYMIGEGKTYDYTSFFMRFKKQYNRISSDEFNLIFKTALEAKDYNFCLLLIKEAKKYKDAGSSDFNIYYDPGDVYALVKAKEAQNELRVSLNDADSSLYYLFRNNKPLSDSNAICKQLKENFTLDWQSEDEFYLSQIKGFVHCGFYKEACAAWINLGEEKQSEIGFDLIEKQNKLLD